MFCSKCGAENAIDSRFCSQCGTPIELEPSAERDKSVCKTSEDSLKSTENRIFEYKKGQFVCAKILSVSADSYYCECIDGISTFFVKKSYAKLSDDSQAQIGDYIWAKLDSHIKTIQNKKRYKAFATTVKQRSTYADYDIFAQQYKPGDILLAPVEDVQQDYVLVRIMPKLTAIAYKSELPQHTKMADLHPGDIYRFVIHQMISEKNRVVLRLCGKADNLSKQLWALLPAHLEDVIFPNSLLKIIEDQCKNGDIKNVLQDGISRPTMIQFLEPLYQEAYQQRQISVAQKGNIVYMDFDTGLKNAKGAPISAAFKRLNSEQKWIMSLFGFTNAERVFDRFIYVENMGTVVNSLADLTLSGEEWDYGGTQSKEKYILQQYLRFTFYKAKLDNLLVEDSASGDAVFNTGLVDATYDEIYCYLKKNTHTDDFFKRKWELCFFACWGKDNNGKILNRKFPTAPPAPQYIHPQKMQDIYYDVTKDLFCDYKHIVEDNLARLPINFIRKKISYHTEMKTLIDTYTGSRSFQNFSALREAILENDGYLREIVDGLKSAVETAKKYCKWNYKTAIPIYYPRNNTVSLLLPLCLTNDENRADIALVVERLENGNYQGQTILTLQMAYQDARLICRPNSEWLTISNIQHPIDEDCD